MNHRGSLSGRVEQLSSAKPAAIYDLLMDVERWSDWMPTMSAASWERRGEPDTGRGGIIGLSVIGDRIFAAKGLPGDIRIEDRPNGCRMIWTVTCVPRIPGFEKYMKARLGAAYTRPFLGDSLAEAGPIGRGSTAASRLGGDPRRIAEEHRNHQQWRH